MTLDPEEQVIREEQDVELEANDGDWDAPITDDGV